MAASHFAGLDRDVVMQGCIEQIHALEQSFTDKQKQRFNDHMENGKENAELPLVVAALHNDVQVRRRGRRRRRRRRSGCGFV